MSGDTQTLREFQQALFERLRNASTEDPARSSRLAFEAGGLSWVMRLDEAQEVVPIVPISPVPLARPWYRGLVNVRGNLFSVVDLGCMASGSLTRVDHAARLVLLADRFRLGAALLVDRVIGLRSIDGFVPVDAGPAPRPDGVMQCLRSADSVVWHELSVPALAQSSEFLHTGF
jgi:twitching motility protein PilI